MPSQPHRFDALHQHFDRQLRLCDTLESVADSLPGPVDRQLCLSLARAVTATLGGLHGAEEETLFPVLRQLGDTGNRLVEGLRFDQVEDQCFAEEVEYELLLLGQGRPTLSPESTGYMLRGYFSSLRRHVRREIEYAGLIRHLC